MLEGGDKGWTGQSASQSSIVAAIHVAVLGLLESADASGDLRMSPEPGKTAVARNALCFADHPVLCAVGPSIGVDDSKGNRNRARDVFPGVSSE